jgi:inosine/xanthosine triphosphatase
MTIYIASTRAAKVDGTRDAISALAVVEPRFREARLVPVDVGDAAPRMPMSETEILGGAVARARALISGVPRQMEDDEVFYIGLEGGLDSVGLSDGSVMVALKSWAAVTDGTRWNYGGGGAIAVPEALVQEVHDGRELGDIVDALVGSPVRGTRGAWGVLTRDLITRRDSFRLAVINAFAPFVNPGLYSNQTSVNV